MGIRFAVWLRFLRRSLPTLVLTGLFTLSFGELYMRLPGVTRVLLCEPDRELNGRLAPDQHGFIWLGGMAVRSAPATINSDGHRGPETDWSKPVVLVVGDSDCAGMGVVDEDVWTSVLEAGLRRQPGRAGIEVVNASHPGHGPYHNAVRFRRVLEKRRVEALIVRVSIADRLFRPVPEDSRDERFAASAMRQRIRGYTRFLPFLYNKLIAQAPRVSAAAVPNFLRKSAEPVDELKYTREMGRDMWAVHKQWWAEILDRGKAANVPVLFVVHDPFDEEGHRLLEENLRAMASRTPNAHVLRVGAAAFGLEGMDDNARRRTFHTRLTVHGDPHANAEQHALVAKAVLPGLLRTLGSN